MKKTNFKIWLLFIISMVFLLSSCLKEYKHTDKITKETNYHPTVAFALAKSKLSVRDIFRDYDKDEIFQVASDGSLFLKYKKRVFTQNAEQLIQFEDQHFPTFDQYNKTNYDLVFAEDGYKTFPTIPVPNPFIVSNEQKLDFVVFDNIDLMITVNSSFHLEGELSIKFPDLKVNNEPIVANIELDNSGAFHYVLNKKLTNCILGFEGDNNVIAELNLKLKDGTANTGEKIDITMEMNNLDFKTVKGYVGRIATSIPTDTIQISTFNNAFNGQIWFENPSITLNIDNSFCLPIRTYFGDFKTYSIYNDSLSSQSGTWSSFPFPKEYIDFDYPIENEGSKHSNIAFNEDDFPQISSLISEYPKYLIFNIDSVITNHNGYNPEIKNFVSDTSRLAVEVDIRLPFKGNALYSLVDTVDMEIGKDFSKITDNFSEINLRTIFDNALPCNIYAQIIFLDSLSLPIDTMFKGGFQGNRLINLPILDDNGKVLSPVKTVNNLTFGEGVQYDHKVSTLKRVKKAIVIATLKTNNNGDVGENAPKINFFSYNYLEIAFGIKGTININNSDK